MTGRNPGITNSGRYANRVKQAVCKTVALGPCWFKSNSADFMPQSLNRVEALFGRQLVGEIPACGFKSRLWRFIRGCVLIEQAACPENR